jgi:predicted metal-dependent hydrolase
MTPLRTRINGRDIDFLLHASQRARRMSLSARPGVGLVATVPAAMRFPAVERFLAMNAGWVLRAAEWLSGLEGQVFLPRGRRDYLKRKEEARRFVIAALHRHNVAHGFSWRRISIRNQTARWGSCSKSGSLNFNWKIVCLPPHLAEYVVVHELCHLGAFDHSRRFWSLVEKTVPDARARRTAIRAYHL